MIIMIFLNKIITYNHPNWDLIPSMKNEAAELADDLVTQVAVRLDQQTLEKDPSR
jgi:hypothetical protein